MVFGPYLGNFYRGQLEDLGQQVNGVIPIVCWILTHLLMLLSSQASQNDFWCHNQTLIHHIGS